MKVLATLAVICLLPAIAHSQVEKSGPWEIQDSRTTASLRGIHAVGGGVAWASGTNGTVLRTEDSGYMWQSCAMPPGAEKLDFRGIWAWDADNAVIMSSGPGDQSRLYKTTDGCSHWTLLYTNPDKDGFWDAIQFTTRGHGILLGDPTSVSNSNGKSDLALTIMKTLDGGTTWTRDPATEGSIRVADGTGAFAASNSSIALTIRFAVALPFLDWHWRHERRAHACFWKILRPNPPTANLWDLRGTSADLRTRELSHYVDVQRIKPADEGGNDVIRNLTRGPRLPTANRASVPAWP